MPQTTACKSLNSQTSELKVVEDLEDSIEAKKDAKAKPDEKEPKIQ